MVTQTPNLNTLFNDITPGSKEDAEEGDAVTDGAEYKF